MSRFRMCATAILVMLIAAVATGARAQTPTPVPDVSGNTPRSAMRGFLEAARAGDYERAALYLDLRALPASQRSRAPELAKDLQVVLDRTLWVDLETLSDEPEGMSDDGLPPFRDLVGTIWAPSGKVDVFLDRVGGPDEPAWKIAAPTVRQIPTLYREFGYGRLTELLPKPFFDIRFAGLQLWQWIGILVLALAAALAAWLTTSLVLRALRLLLVRSRLAFEAPHLPLAIGPIQLLVAALIFEGGSAFLALPVPTARLVNGVVEALVIFAIVWLCWRTTDVFANAAERRLYAQGKRAAAGLVPFWRRTLKVSLTVIALIAIFQNFGFNVSGVLAALGVGGLAVALAAQKTVENLFGGITVIADQPVRVGDLCRFGDRMGTVEEIGLRSTRLRTPERTVVSVPNAEFAAMQLENFSRRDRIRLSALLGLRYETTVEQLRVVVAELHKLLVGHPKIVPNSASARFAGFGAASLDVEVVGYVATNDNGEFLAIREELLLRMMDVVSASGTVFAASKAPLPPPAAVPAGASPAAQQAGTPPPAQQPAPDGNARR